MLTPALIGVDDGLLDARILIVDDVDANLLLLTRILESAGFTTIRSCNQSSEVVDEVSLFEPELLILDLHMPPPDGFELLEKLKATEAADGVFLPILVLTADATKPARDRALGLGANDFLTKPFDSVEVVLRASSLLRTRRMNHEIHELLEQTLTGSIDSLLDVLSLANPRAFSRAGRIRHTVGALADELSLTNRWEIDIAAGLSQIGSVTLGEELAKKLDMGRPLSQAEKSEVDRLPAIACQLVDRIPRMEAVGEMLRRQDDRFYSGRARDDAKQPPLGARLLRVATDLDEVEAKGVSRVEAIAVLRSRERGYDPAVLEAASRMAAKVGIVADGAGPVEVQLAELRAGHRLAVDLCNANGVLLLSRGHVFTERGVDLLRNVADRFDGPIYVFT